MVLLFPLPDLVALASPLPVTIPTAVAGAYSYWRRGLVRRDVVLWTTVGGLPGVVLGALGTRVVAVSWLMGLTGLFVVVIGVVVGILSGLLANGGGFLLVAAIVFGDVTARFLPGRPAAPAVGRADIPASTGGR